MTKKVTTKKVENKLPLEKLIHQDRELITKNCKTFKEVITFEDAIRLVFASKKFVEKIKAKTITLINCSKNKAGEIKVEFIFSNDHVSKKTKTFVDELLKDLLKEAKTHKC